MTDEQQRQLVEKNNADMLVIYERFKSAKVVVCLKGGDDKNSTPSINQELTQ